MNMFSDEELLSCQPVYVGSWTTFLQDVAITDETREAHAWRMSIVKYFLERSGKFSFCETAKTSTIRVNDNGRRFNFVSRFPEDDALKRQMCNLKLLLNFHQFYDDHFWIFRYAWNLEIDNMKNVIDDIMRCLNLNPPTQEDIQHSLELHLPPFSVQADNIRMRHLVNDMQIDVSDMQPDNAVNGPIITSTTN